MPLRSLRSFVLVVPLALGLSLAAVAGGDAPGGHEGAPNKPRATKHAPDKPRATMKATSVADAWRALPSITGHGCADDDLIFDYEESGGMRNFFCRALTVFSWKTFLRLAPVTPFRAGPHKDGRLDLHSERDFGRYDPRFVAWAADSLVPAAKDPGLRAQTQPVYDRFVRTLARTYWEVHRALWSDPAWREAETRFYLRAADEGNVAWAGAGTALYHDVLGEDWGGYDPNHIRAAATWWLRRSHDGTADQWHEGLTRLLETYDGAWLKAHRAQWTGKLPRRESPADPEYR